MGNFECHRYLFWLILYLLFLTVQFRLTCATEDESSEDTDFEFPRQHNIFKRSTMNFQHGTEASIVASNQERPQLFATDECVFNSKNLRQFFTEETYRFGKIKWKREAVSNVSNEDDIATLAKVMNDRNLSLVDPDIHQKLLSYVMTLPDDDHQRLIRTLAKVSGLIRPLSVLRVYDCGINFDMGNMTIVNATLTVNEVSDGIMEGTLQSGFLVSGDLLLKNKRRSVFNITMRNIHFSGLTQPTRCEPVRPGVYSNVSLKVPNAEAVGMHIPFMFKGNMRNVDATSCLHMAMTECPTTPYGQTKKLKYTRTCPPSTMKITGTKTTVTRNITESKPVTGTTITTATTTVVDTASTETEPSERPVPDIDETESVPWEWLTFPTIGPSHYASPGQTIPPGIIIPPGHTLPCWVYTPKGWSWSPGVHVPTGTIPWGEELPPYFPSQGVIITGIPTLTSGPYPTIGPSQYATPGQTIPPGIVIPPGHTLPCWVYTPKGWYWSPGVHVPTGTIPFGEELPPYFPSQGVDLTRRTVSPIYPSYPTIGTGQFATPSQTIPPGIIIPPGHTLPCWVYTPKGWSWSPGVHVPSGTIPFGEELPPYFPSQGVDMTRYVTIVSTLYPTIGPSQYATPGQTIPPGIVIPPGYTLPCWVYTPKGWYWSPGVHVPTGTIPFGEELPPYFPSQGVDHTKIPFTSVTFYKTVGPGHLPTPGETIPPGVLIPSGITLPCWMKTPPGWSWFPGATFPTGTYPPGVDKPDFFPTEGADLTRFTFPTTPYTGSETYGTGVTPSPGETIPSFVMPTDCSLPYSFMTTTAGFKCSPGVVYPGGGTYPPGVTKPPWFVVPPTTQLKISTFPSDILDFPEGKFMYSTLVPPIMVNRIWRCPTYAPFFLKYCPCRVKHRHGVECVNFKDYLRNFLFCIKYAKVHYPQKTRYLCPSASTKQCSLPSSTLGLHYSCVTKVMCLATSECCYFTTSRVVTTCLTSSSICPNTTIYCKSSTWPCEVTTTPCPTTTTTSTPCPTTTCTTSCTTACKTKIYCPKSTCANNVFFNLKLLDPVTL